MFELVVVACLSGKLSETCAERLLPSPEPLTKAACEATSLSRTKSWQLDNPHLVLGEPHCLLLDEAGHAFSLTEIASGVFVHRGGIGIPDSKNLGDLANLSIVIGDTSVAVIDAGGSREVGERFYRAIRKLTDKPISTVIITHMHPDHSFGASVFVEAGATLIGHQKLERGLRARAENYAASLDQMIGAEGFIGTIATFPTEGVDGERVIDLGNRVLDLRAWPTAHTDNDLTVFDRASGTLFAGDLVFAEHTPALDGSLIGWLDVLEALDDDIKHVVPGHGPAALPWPEGGEALREYLYTLADDTRAAIRRGESIAQAVEHIGQSEREKWLLFDEFNIRNATAAYKELEWE